MDQVRVLVRDERPLPPARWVGEAVHLAWDHSDDGDEQPENVVSRAIVYLFNPPDDDVAYESLLVDALERAAHFIATKPCMCPPDADDWGPCDRCEALGRVNDTLIAR